MPLSSPPDGRVLIAMDPGDGFLESNPTWTRIDDTDSLVAEIEISTGRQTEFDQTETGTAVVHINDRDGLFDPNNVSSPYFGNLDGKQIVLQLWDPVAEEWYQRFRGIVDEYGYDIHPATRDGVPILGQVQIMCVDLFEYLAGFEMLPGVHGDVPPAGSEGTVFWEDGGVDTRFTALLNTAVNSDFYVVFEGNVNVMETKYDGGDSLLVGLRDAADAEQPVLANIYVDRRGRFVFHGRFARLDPEGVIADGPVSTDAWDFQRWSVGDGAAMVAEPLVDWVQVRPPFNFRRARNKIINAALCFPRDVLEAEIPTLVYSDAGSMTSYGPHSWSSTDLIVEGHKTNGNNANDECLLAATYVVENNKTPENRIEALTVKALDPLDPRAPMIWQMLGRSDISDGVRVKVGYAGGTGIDDEFYIEGWTQTIRPLNPTHDMVELTLNVSPAPTVDVYS